MRSVRKRERKEISEIKSDPLGQSNQDLLFLLYKEIAVKAARVNCKVKRKFARSSGEMPEEENE